MSDLRDLPVASILVEDRARQDFGGPEFENLKQSIREKGLLQPITVNDHFALRAGGRRLQACIDLGLETIPVLVRPDTSAVDAKEVELFENIHRKNLTWQEQDKIILGIHTLYADKHGEEWTQNKTAGLLDRSVGGISNIIHRAKAAEVIPELAECKHGNDAMRMLKKLEEGVIVKQMAASLREEIAEEQQEQEEGRKPRLVEHADSHFRVGDAIEGLAELKELYQEKESSIALFEVDPPYAVDLQQMKRQATQHGSMHLQQYTEIDSSEYREWLRNLYSLCYHAAATHAWMIAWFGPTWFTETKIALTGAGWSVDDMPLIWTKSQGQTQQPEHYLGRAYEMAFICRKGKPLINKRGRINVFQFDSVPGAKKYHPTQRPVALMKELLATFGFPGQVICIPFLGSGSTLKAAYQQEMMGFGWDLDQKNKDRFLLSLDGDG